MAADAPVLAGAALGRDRAAVSERKVPISTRRRRYLTEPTPWRRVNVVRALIPVVVGIVISAVCWWNISGKVTLEEQQGAMIGSFFGAAIAALGGVYWFMVNLREVRIGQRQLVADIAGVMDWPLTRDGRVRRGSAADAAETDTSLRLVTGPGMTFVHRSDCPVTKGKSMREVSGAEAHLDHCGICLPSGGAR
jgi:hypothetical protein